MIFDPRERKYSDFTQLSNGQTAGIEFYKYLNGKNTEWTVAFGIADKKKHLRKWLDSSGMNPLGGCQTGTCGFEGLIWARDKILEFIEMKKDSGNVLIISGADNRRFRLYEKYFQRYGFKKKI